MKLPTNVAGIESFLAQLSKQDIDFNLELEALLKPSSFPLEDISRAQALNTWLRAAPADKRRVIFGDESPNLDFKTMGSTALGLIALARARDWFSKEQQKPLLNIRNGYFQQMNDWPDLAVTDTTLIMCDDAYSKGLPWPLFDPSGHFRNDAYFERFVPKLVGSVMRSDDLRGAILHQSSLLTTLIYEIVKNTQDHALFNASGSEIQDSVRLLLVRYYDLASLKIPEGNSIDEPLEPHVGYLKALQDKPRSGLNSAVRKRFHGVLEFSMLDSGPGFVGRRLQREVGAHEDIDIEYQAVLSCLRAGHSTARNPNRGLGLNDVLRALRAMNGFIRVRTNRLSGYREFKIFSDSKEKDVSPVLHDWKRGYSTKATPFSNVRGAAVSVLIPVEA